MRRPTSGLFRSLVALLAGTLLMPAAFAGMAAACDAESVRPACLAERAFAAVDDLPADERGVVLGTLLGVHLTQHRAVPPALLAAARRVVREARVEERLPVLLPLAEIARRAHDDKAATKARQAAEVILAKLAGRRSRPEAFLQIADTCVGLADMLGGAPVLVPQWAGLYRRYCQPAFFARLQVDQGFKGLVKAHLLLVGHFLVQDRTAFRVGLPGVVNALRSVDTMLETADELSAAERETAMVVASALQMSAGTLACLLELEDECEAVMSGIEIPDEVGQPGLWSTWAAIAAVRGEGLAAGGRPLGGVGALNWLLARAGEARHRSHRAAFLASAAWLADRLEALRKPRRESLSI